MHRFRKPQRRVGMHYAAPSLLAVLALLSACSSIAGSVEAPTIVPAARSSAASIPAASSAASQSSSEPVPSTNTGGKLAISFATYGYERSSYEPLIEEFEAQNPDLRVQFVDLDQIVSVEDGAEIDWEARRRRIASAADTYTSSGDVGPDIARDLKPLMDADASFEADDFPPMCSTISAARTARSLCCRSGCSSS